MKRALGVSGLGLLFGVLLCGGGTLSPAEPAGTLKTIGHA